MGKHLIVILSPHPFLPRLPNTMAAVRPQVDIPALRGNEFVTCIPTGPAAGARASPGAAAAAKSKSISALKVLT